METKVIDYDKGEHIYPVQKQVALFSALASAVTVFLNIIYFFTVHSPLFVVIFNISTLLPFVCVFIVTYFVNHQVCRVIHIILYALCGFLTLISVERFFIIAFLFIFDSMMLSIIYGFLKIRSWKIVGFILIAITTVIFIGKTNLFNKSTFTFIYSTTDIFVYILFIGYLIFLIISAIKIELLTSANIVQEAILFNRIGQNASGLLYYFFTMAPIGYLKLAKNAVIEKKSRKESARYITKAYNFFQKGKDDSDMLLSAIQERKLKVVTTIDVHRILKATAILIQANSEVYKNIKMVTGFHREPLFIKAIPFEFQNIIFHIVDNAVDSLMHFKREPNENFKNLIRITTCITSKNYVQIVISDNGLGFIDVEKDMKVEPDKIRSTKAGGGFGLQYIRLMTDSNNGKVEFYNNADQGARVILSFKHVKVDLKKMKAKETAAKEEKRKSEIEEWKKKNGKALANEE